MKRQSGGGRRHLWALWHRTSSCGGDTALWCSIRTVIVAEGPEASAGEQAALGLPKDDVACGCALPPGYSAARWAWLADRFFDCTDATRAAAASIGWRSPTTGWASGVEPWPSGVAARRRAT